MRLISKACDDVCTPNKKSTACRIKKAEFHCAQSCTNVVLAHAMLGSSVLSNYLTKRSQNLEVSITSLKDYTTQAEPLCSLRKHDMRSNDAHSAAFSLDKSSTKFVAQKIRARGYEPHCPFLFLCIALILVPHRTR